MKSLLWTNRKKKTIYQIKIETIFSRQFEFEKQRKNRQLHEFQIQTIDKKMFEFLYLRWIIIVNFFFDQIFNDDFRVFLHYVNVFVNNMFFRFDNTIKKRNVKFFKKNQKKIKMMLRQSIFDIHIICDVWNFSNHLNLLIVVFHFVNKNRLAVYEFFILINELFAFDKWTFLLESFFEIVFGNFSTHIFCRSSILSYKNDFSVENISKQSIYCLFVYLTFYLSISLSFYLSYLSVQLSFYLFILMNR